MEERHIGKSQKIINKLRSFGWMLTDGEILMLFQFAQVGDPTGFEESQVPPPTGKLLNASLKVRIACYAAFLMWIFGGTSLESTPHFSLMIYLNFWLASLSKICKSVVMPLLFGHCMIELYTASMCWYFLVLKGATKNDIGIIIGYHNVLVSTSSPHREFACIICVQLACVYWTYVYLVWWWPQLLCSLVCLLLSWDRSCGLWIF